MAMTMPRPSFLPSTAKVNVNQTSSRPYVSLAFSCNCHQKYFTPMEYLRGNSVKKATVSLFEKATQQHDDFERKNDDVDHADGRPAKKLRSHAVLLKTPTPPIGFGLTTQTPWAKGFPHKTRFITTHPI